MTDAKFIRAAILARIRELAASTMPKFSVRRGAENTIEIIVTEIPWGQDEQTCRALAQVIQQVVLQHDAVVTRCGWSRWSDALIAIDADGGQP